MIEPNKIITGDCIKVLSKPQKTQADLIFADPPFNIGFKYDVYEDRKAYDDYYAWTEKWMAACAGALKDNGSMWIAIGDEYAAEIRVIGRKLGLNLRNWVIWHYTFGQAAQTKFARSHAHLFYWTKTTDHKAITFNDMDVRIPSARQTTYGDARANPKGKLPDDVWSFSRVCGTFHERVKWHPCQMPEKVLERIIKVSSNPGDLVMDPFSGSGTTCAVAAQLERNYFGIDLSKNYVKHSTQRIADTLAGNRRGTEISENPELSRPQRKVGGSGQSKKAKKLRKQTAK
ncbi:MAG: site-specific DNA-methyltransferase [Phycisphaerales bacterium]|jgi:DNA modification methylase|nr:site-specific DNA-methyltransferase [Phycisphaerales bacterium]